MIDQHELMTEAAKGLPPATIAATSVLGLVDWPTWVAILTVVYLLLQITALLWKMADKWNGKP